MSGISACLLKSRLEANFREVEIDNPKTLCFEQIATKPCPNDHPEDHLHHLVDAVRLNLWMTVATIPPYRRYYIYLCPPTERDHLLPQLLSMYAVTFYLGSITRYRPHHFDAILKGAYGPRVRDFVTGQPLPVPLSNDVRRWPNATSPSRASYSLPMPDHPQAAQRRGWSHGRGTPVASYVAELRPTPAL